MLFVRFRTIEQGLFPIAITLKTTPIVAIAPLLVLWLGTGWWSKVAAAVLISFFPVLVNTVKGLKAPEADFQDLFRTMRADPSQIFRKLRVPYCLPYFFSALKISSSLAIVGAIVGEFVGAEHGLGYLIVISSAHLETPTVFQAIGAAALIGIAMFYALEFFEKRVVFWIASRTGVSHDALSYRHLPHRHGGTSRSHRAHRPDRGRCARARRISWRSW